MKNQNLIASVILSIAILLAFVIFPLIPLASEPSQNNVSMLVDTVHGAVCYYNRLSVSCVPLK